MQSLQEKMHRGMNLTIRDESADEREGEGKVNQEEEEEVLNPKEENIFNAISKIGQRPKLMFPHLQFK